MSLLYAITLRRIDSGAARGLAMLVIALTCLVSYTRPVDDFRGAALAVNRFVAADESVPILLASGLMLGSIGMLLSSAIRQLENFAGVMNFVIFPMFFLSSALYPLWRMRESSEFIYQLCAFNPFTHAVESIRFALYLQLNTGSILIVILCTVVSFGLAVWAYDSRTGFSSRRLMS